MHVKYSKSLDIVIIGAGNVAFHLSRALQENGHRIIQVLGRSHKNASELASLINCEYIINVQGINKNAHLYILCVPDSAIPQLAKSLPKLNGMIVHTSGSTNMSVLSQTADHYGVLYPFQTFSKNTEMDFRDVPFFIEASSPETQRLLIDMVLSLQAKPIEMDSETRKWLHISGVFSCNFVNHMLAISYLINQNKGISFQSLKPLVFETIKKAFESNPLDTQTGPAIRGDSETIRNHVALLTTMDEDIRDLYMAISTSILNFNQDN
jgi:predicted short-subunit dehydrogenase-like oxidoreductase (DUF2520 family)